MPVLCFLVSLHIGEFFQGGFFFLEVVTFFVTLRADLEDYFNAKDEASVEVGVNKKGQTSLEVGVEAMAKGVGAGGKFFLTNRLLFGT